MSKPLCGRSYDIGDSVQVYAMHGRLIEELASDSQGLTQILS